MKTQRIMIETIRSIAFLAPKCREHSDMIATCGFKYADYLWEWQYRTFKKQTEGDTEKLNLLVETYWNEIGFQVVKTIEAPLYSFRAITGPTVNPPGKEGCVQLICQPTKSLMALCTILDPAAYAQEFKPHHHDNE